MICCNSLQSMLLPIFEDRRGGASEEIIKTISTRIAGGRREVDTQPSQVRMVPDLSESEHSLHP